MNGSPKSGISSFVLCLLMILVVLFMIACFVGGLMFGTYLIAVVSTGV